MSALPTWNDPWLLVSCHRNNFCVVKGHFCSFLVSNIYGYLRNSADWRCNFDRNNIFFRILIFCFIQSLQRDGLISRNDIGLTDCSPWTFPLFFSDDCIFQTALLWLNHFDLLFREFIFTLSLLPGSDLKNNFLRLTCLIILWRLNASRKWLWQFIFGYSFIKDWPFCRDLQNDFPFGNLSAYRKLCFLVVCFSCVMHIPVCQ